MVTTDSNGIARLQDSDGAPTTPVLNMLMQSVSDSIDEIGAYRVAANETAQTQLVNEYTPSPANPLLVYRQDLPPERAFQFTRNGSTWYPLSASGQATSTGDALNFSNASVVMHVDGPFVTLSGFVRHTAPTGGLSTTWKPAGTIPAQFTPLRDAEIFPIYSNLQASVYCRVLRDGQALQFALQSGTPSVALSTAHVFYLSGIRWRYI